MGKYLFLLLIVLTCWATSSCEPPGPAPDCPRSGNFVATVKNEDGWIRYHFELREYVLYFSLDGSLQQNMVGIPCHLSEEFREDIPVIFDADIYETKDSLKLEYRTFAVKIRKIKK